MNMSALYTLATVFAVVAFFGIVWWVLDPKNKKRFNDDANIVLDTDPIYQEQKLADKAKREN